MHEKIERDFSRRHERKTKTPEQALAAMMRLCARAEKSSGDAMRLMAGWGVSADDARKVLAKLEKERFIDDRRYAEAYVREKTNLNGWGSYKIRRMLSSKGIGQGIIDDVLGKFDRSSSKARLDEMLARKTPTVRAANNYELKGKLVRYGLSLGYDYDQVVQAVEEAIGKS